MKESQTKEYSGNSANNWGGCLRDPPSNCEMKKHIFISRNERFIDLSICFRNCHPIYCEKFDEYLQKNKRIKK